MDAWVVLVTKLLLGLLLEKYKFFMCYNYISIILRLDGKRKGIDMGEDRL